MTDQQRDAHIEAQTELLRLMAMMMAEILRRSSKHSMDVTAQVYDEGVSNITSNLKRTLRESQRSTNE